MEMKEKKKKSIFSLVGKVIVAIIVLSILRKTKSRRAMIPLR